MSEERSGPARARVHATSIVLGGAALAFGGPDDIAVLLLGAAGSGKSDVALRLIANGARLIADDQTDLSVTGGRLYASAPSGANGMMEIRGSGIVRLDAADAAPVVLAVELEPVGIIARMPEPEFFVPQALGPSAALPLVRLRPFEASTPAKIAAIASAIARGRFVAGAAADPSKDA